MPKFRGHAIAFFLLLTALSSGAARSQQSLPVPPATLSAHAR